MIYFVAAEHNSAFTCYIPPLPARPNTMEEPRHALAESQHLFLQRMKTYLQLPLYYYGSVQRADYFAEESDIDVAIFSPTPESTLQRLVGFLHLSRADMKPFFWKLDVAPITVRGHKFAVQRPDDGIACDICVYDLSAKDMLLREYQDKIDLPAWAIVALCIVKWLFYHLSVLSLDSYKNWKKKIMATATGGSYGQQHFVLLE